MSCDTVFDCDDSMAYIDTVLSKIPENGLFFFFAEDQTVKGKDRRRLITWEMWFWSSELLRCVTCQKQEDTIHTAAEDSNLADLMR